MLWFYLHPQPRSSFEVQLQHLKNERYAHLSTILTIVNSDWVRGHPKLSMLNQMYKAYSFRGRVNGKETLIPYTFNILNHFFNHFHDKLSIWKILMFTLFHGGGRIYESMFVHSSKCWQLWMAPNWITESLFHMMPWSKNISNPSKSPPPFHQY